MDTCSPQGALNPTSMCCWLTFGHLCGQAALDVFEKEPPTDNPLVGRPDVVCTPHLGASTTEAQEGVAVEIAEAVIGALKVSSTLAAGADCYQQYMCCPQQHLLTHILQASDTSRLLCVQSNEHVLRGRQGMQAAVCCLLLGLPA